MRFVPVMFSKEIEDLIEASILPGLAGAWLLTRPWVWWYAFLAMLRRA